MMSADEPDTHDDPPESGQPSDAGAPRPPYAGFVVGAAPMAAVQPTGGQPGGPVGHPAAPHVVSSVAAKLASKPKTSRGAAAALAAAQQRRAVGPLTVNGGAGK